MLVDDLKKLLASNFSLYLKASQFHWNVEGVNFPQYHEFLGDFYSEIYDSIDRVAEYVRALNEYAPGSLAKFSELSLISDQEGVPDSLGMMRELASNNLVMLGFLKELFNTAVEANEQGIANFIAERIDAHEKHGWMLRSILK